jgi:mRNA interferase HigB
LKVIGEGVIAAAKQKHSDLDGPLSAWLQIARKSTWTCLNDIRKTWASTDAVDGKFIFNIKGNKYRLIVTINFRSLLLTIGWVLTHAEYDRGGWR